MTLGVADLVQITLLQRDELDDEVAEAVVEALPVGNQGVVGHGLLHLLEVGPGALVDRDLSVLTLGEALGILVERAACGFR